MKKIDMHSHVGKFGGWAGFDSDIDTLIKFMDEYEVEKTVLCSADANTNEDTLAAFEKAKPKLLSNPVTQSQGFR